MLLPQKHEEMASKIELLSRSLHRTVKSKHRDRDTTTRQPT